MQNTIRQYHQDLLSGETTCLDTVRVFLDRIKQQEILNAFVEVYETEALEKAAELDKKRSMGSVLGKLHGVVVALKDVICYQGHKVTAASAILKNFTSIYSASVVQYLLAEEAIIIGNCNCDEFAMGSSNENSVYGPVRNSLDHTKVPGGSSGGSAVAVQANLCMVSLGSDTGGSVRQPADFCGVIGLKPGYGTVSRYGLIAYASSFDQIGIFGKHVEDVQKVLEVISQSDPNDSTMRHAVTSAEIKTGTKKRFAVLKDALYHPALDKEIQTAIFGVLEQYKQAGHEVTEIDFGLIDYVVPAYYVLTAAEASSNLSRYDGVRYGHQTNRHSANVMDYYTLNRTEGFGMEVKRRIMLGNFVLSSGYYDAYYSKAQKVRRLLVNKVNEIFESYDAILMPVSPTTAFEIGEKKQDPVAMYLADIFTVFANLTGIASIALPLFQHSNGMPFGMQLLMPSGKEKELLDLSEYIMSHQTEAS